jgi:hypothetical protein
VLCWQQAMPGAVPCARIYSAIGGVIITVSRHAADTHGCMPVSVFSSYIQ